MLGEKRRKIILFILRKAKLFLNYSNMRMSCVGWCLSLIGLVKNIQFSRRLECTLQTTVKMPMSDVLMTERSDE